MSYWKTLRRLTRRRPQFLLFSGLAIACLVAATVLTMQVFLKLDEYGSSNRDDIQWAMAQLEIDQLKLVNAVVALRGPDADGLQDVRRRFDVFYSRATTLENGSTYARAFTDADSRADLTLILENINAMVPFIDADNETLYAQRQNLLGAMSSLTTPIRRLSATGLTYSIRLVEAERANLTSKLVDLAVLSVVMLLAFLALMILLWRLYHLYRKRAMQNRVTLNRLTAILSTSQDAILVVARHGRIIDINGAAEEMFSLDPSNKRPAFISEFLFQKSDGQDAYPLTAHRLSQSCANGPNRSTNLIARDRAGNEFPVELSANKTSRSGDHVCVCFIRDITRRLAADAEIQSARDKALAGERAKARFLGMISHEMRTPLNGILGSLDLLEDTGLRKEQERYSKIMKSSGQLLLNQINDALDATQADAGQLVLSHDIFDLDELLRDLLLSQQPIAAAANTTLTLLKPDSTGELVQGDRDRVHQVLLNLISNAIKFTRGGEVTIEVSRASGPHHPGDDVEFQISDTGVGIAEQDLTRVFDDFVRLNQSDGPAVEGTGLGLGIARHLVTLMGGQIGAESVKDEGSLFWARIPLPNAQPDHGTRPKPEKKAGPVAPLDILVVEDNPTNRLVLCEMLQKDGHRVVVANDGPKGVAAAAQQFFDLILMDISMPDVDGIEATHRIRHGKGLSAQTRIVALTAHFRPGQEHQLQIAGFNSVQAKPLRRSELRALLAQTGSTRDFTVQPEIIDWLILNQLNSVLPENKLSKLLDGFETEGQALIDDLPDLTSQSGSARHLTARLHSLAGTAASLGATSLQSVLCQAERTVQDGDRATLELILDRLPMVWQETLLEIKQHRRAA